MILSFPTGNPTGMGIRLKLGNANGKKFELTARESGGIRMKNPFPVIISHTHAHACDRGFTTAQIFLRYESAKNHYVSAAAIVIETAQQRFTKRQTGLYTCAICTVAYMYITAQAVGCIGIPVTAG